MPGAWARQQLGEEETGDDRREEREPGRQLGEEACRRFALDWYWTGDDVAGQRCLMMSPAS